ncbi:MAG: hypothetical protein HXX08_12675 [Chloroflexi bacterium]|uniref:Nucleotidyltransferase domain-containing protein n=1 Tax=Candidatus Chlorohelix allophototropha TaxID=3003348 RepID=A0A8T7M3S3_9CHLR|nr:hypothetical protein [Chloroflexota bacterium]WJW66097.1 hypothetical protein OZ401_001881 [Chloroflexota bacterium L227-S17]
MIEIELASTTGNRRIDNILGGVVGLLEIVFPGRILSYYLTGSYADGSQVETSDLDIELIFKGVLTSQERDLVRDISMQLSLLAQIFIDVHPQGESTLQEKVNYFIKLGGHFIYGEDIRDTIPEISTEKYVHWAAHTPISRMLFWRGVPQFLRYPLEAVNPAEEFYGYAQRELILPDGEHVHSIKEMVAAVGWMATAIIAMKTGRVAIGKENCLRLYLELVADEWAGFVEDAFYKGRNLWHYLIPQEVQDREALREICGRVPLFENHYLNLYRNFLLDEIKSPDRDARRVAIHRLGEIIYPGDEALIALKGLESGDDLELQSEINQAIYNIQEAQSLNEQKG